MEARIESTQEAFGSPCRADTNIKVGGGYENSGVSSPYTRSGAGTWLMLSIRYS